MDVSTPLGDGSIPADEQEARRADTGEVGVAGRDHRVERRRRYIPQGRACPFDGSFEVGGVGLDDDDLEACMPQRLGVDPGEAQLEDQPWPCSRQR
jgi:hypothetical protein